MNQERVTNLIANLKSSLQILESELAVSNPYAQVPSTIDLHKEIENYEEWVKEGDVWEELDVTG